MRLSVATFSTRIKDAGIAIRHSQGRVLHSQGSILFYTAGSRNGLEGLTTPHEQVVPKKKNFFVIEKYIEDARQEEKDVPDLLEAIMRPTDRVKEELRQDLMKISQFRPEITKIRV